MNIPEDNDAEEFVVNLTPLIDVVFLLLIFFMVSTTFLEPEREIEVELPTAESGGEPQEAPDELILNIVKDGGIYYQGEKIGLEAKQDRLRLRIPEAHVVFDDEGLAIDDHEPNV